MPTVIRTFAALTLVFVSACVGAQSVRLGYEGNVGLRNPFAGDEDNFGRQLAAGDVDGDGIDDLVAARSGSARIRVLRGNDWTVGAGGLVIKFLAATVDTPSFNGAIALGDFDADGRDEIALGNPSYSQGGVPSQGSVTIMDRAANGIWSIQETIRLGEFGYAGTPGNGDRLGAAMASGDFDEDGFADLAISASGKTVGGQEGAGAVLIAYGSGAGLTGSRSELFTRTNDGQGQAPNADDAFGQALAVADFTNDGPDDLAVGIRRATCPNGQRGGSVVILRGQGSSGGLTSVQSRGYFAGVDGVPGECVGSGAFGIALATGYFNLDARRDLAISARGSGADRGSVTVLNSGTTGPNGGQGSLLVRGIDLPVPPPAGVGFGAFGAQLATGPLRGSANLLDSLAVGMPQDTVDGVEQAGSTWVLHPAVDGSGLTLAGAERWTLRAPLSLSPPGANDQSGSALAVGDFNGDHARDLAIGAYLHDDPATDDGGVQVIYQSEFLFRDDFED